MIDAILLPPDQSITVADFGRTQFAAVLAATTALAAAATRKAPKPRFNLQFILNDLASVLEVLEIADDDIPTDRLSLPHALSFRCGQPRPLLRHDPPRPPGRLL